MPAERGRGTRWIQADLALILTGTAGAQLVWTEPALAPGIAFATNLTPSVVTEGGAGSPAFIHLSSRQCSARDSLALNAYSPPAQRLPPLSLLLRPEWCGTRPHRALSRITVRHRWPYLGLLPVAEKASWHLKAKEKRERHRERFPDHIFRPHRRNRSSVPVPNSRRRQREVPPAGRTRQEHIASLLLNGLSDEVLAEAITKFDTERRERGEGGVQARFDVVDIFAKHLVARSAGHKSMQKGERSTIANPTKGDISADLHSQSSPPLSTGPATSDVSFNIPPLKSSTSKWPYSHSSSTSFPSSSECLLPFDIMFRGLPNVQSYPSSLGLWHDYSAPALLGSPVESLFTYEMGLSSLLAGGCVEQGLLRTGGWILLPAEMEEESRGGRVKKFLKRWIYPFLAMIWSAMAVVATIYEEHHAVLAAGPVVIATIFAVMQEAKVLVAAPKTAMVTAFSLLLFAMLLLAPIINWSTEGVADNSGVRNNIPEY
ncbi:hypothetical protein B0H13DRAFT_2311291 [Mycena leptocephala]|nr:hypothetical protein B0H13DRAFT_2311291 [Mycena leptocephala]